MDIVLMGPPGVGKGTQAVGLAHRLSLVHLATGDLFRQHIGNRTNLGLRAKAYVDRGALVPDELVTDMVVDRMLGPDVAGTLLDGYPRTLGQARGLPAQLARADRRVDAVVLLAAPLEMLIWRIVGRQACPLCNEASNEYSQPTRIDGICDVCGGALKSRTDDNLDTAKDRLEIYREQTLPLAHFYRAAGLLVEVDGSGEPDDVGERINTALGAKMLAPLSDPAWST